MEKIKVDLKDYKLEAEELDLKNGIIVKNRIPYSDKEKMAVEYINSTTSVDENLGICYTIYSSILVWNYLFLKYYTNIDVDDVEDLTILFDYAQSHDLMSDIVKAHVCEDVDHVYDIADIYRESVVTLYEKEHSLEQQVKTILSTDVDTNIAETRELIEKLTDMKGALIEKEEREKVVPFSKNMKLNLSKK